MKEDGVEEKELTKAKNFLKGKMVLKLEDSEEFAHLLSKFELLHGHIMTPEEIEKEINKVSVEDINRVAKDLLSVDRMRIGVIGPYDDKEQFLRALK